MSEVPLYWTSQHVSFVSVEVAAAAVLRGAVVAHGIEEGDAGVPR